MSMQSNASAYLISDVLIVDKKILTLVYKHTVMRSMMIDDTRYCTSCHVVSMSLNVVLAYFIFDKFGKTGIDGVGPKTILAFRRHFRWEVVRKQECV